MPSSEVAQLLDLRDGGHPLVVERRAGNRQSFQLGQSFQGREARTVKALHPERRMEERQRPQAGQRSQFCQAGIADLDAVGTQFFELG